MRRASLKLMVRKRPVVDFHNGDSDHYYEYDDDEHTNTTAFSASIGPYIHHQSL